jgi:AcrR family transcriptional regulator
MARPVEKREHIERGIVEVVARKGLHGTTIQDIAGEARVSAGLLYRYWRDRNDLAGEVYRKHYQALLEHLGALAAREKDVWSKLKAIVHGFLRYADENPTLLKFILLSQHDLHRTVPPENGVRAFLQGMIRGGMGTGRLRQMDPELAAQLFLGIVLQPVVGALYGDLALPLEQHEEEIVGALARVLLDDNGSAPRGRQ